MRLLIIIPRRPVPVKRLCRRKTGYRDRSEGRSPYLCRGAHASPQLIQYPPAKKPQRAAHRTVPPAPGKIRRFCRSPSAAYAPLLAAPVYGWARRPRREGPGSPSAPGPASVPPWTAAIRRAAARPSPAPSAVCSSGRELSPSRRPLCRPGPLSHTVMTARPRSAAR